MYVHHQFLQIFYISKIYTNIYIYMYTSNTPLCIYICIYTCIHLNTGMKQLTPWWTSELWNLWNSSCKPFFYDQVECSGWAYGILILAARAATKFPRQLLEFRAISRKWENDGIWIKHFKRTALVQEFLLIKSYERLFGAICAIHFFLTNRLHFEPLMFSKGPFFWSLTLAAAAVRQHSNLFNFDIFRRPLVPKTGMPGRVDGRTKASLDSKRGSRNGKGPREIQDNHDMLKTPHGFKEKPQFFCKIFVCLKFSGTETVLFCHLELVWHEQQIHTSYSSLYIWILHLHQAILELSSKSRSPLIPQGSQPKNRWSLTSAFFLWREVSLYVAGALSWWKSSRPLCSTTWLSYLRGQKKGIREWCFFVNREPLRFGWDLIFPVKKLCVYDILYNIHIYIYVDLYMVHTWWVVFFV